MTPVSVKICGKLPLNMPYSSADNGFTSSENRSGGKEMNRKKVLPDRKIHIRYIRSIRSADRKNRMRHNIAGRSYLSQEISSKISIV